MKSVLMSIQPKWCQLIVGGKKTIVVRKTKPKLEVPFKVYIYCTYGEGLIEANDKCLPNHLIGRKVSKYKTWQNCCNGKVIGEFMCDTIFDLHEKALFAGMDEINKSVIEEYSCVDIDELLHYKGNKNKIYGWGISDLVIYDEPKELGEFKKINREWRKRKGNEHKRYGVYSYNVYK